MMEGKKKSESVKNSGFSHWTENEKPNKINEKMVGARGFEPLPSIRVM